MNVLLLFMSVIIYKQLGSNEERERDVEHVQHVRSQQQSGYRWVQTWLPVSWFSGSVEVLVAWLETKLLVFRLYGHCFRGRPKVDLEDIVEKAPVQPHRVWFGHCWCSLGGHDFEESW